MEKDVSVAGAGVGIAEPPRRQRPIAARVCPSCRGPLQERPRRWRCLGCERAYPIVAGLPDLRVRPDRYLTLDAERSKARRLARLEPSTDVMGLATAYYAITEDVDRSRRERYLTHLSRAELRGEALAQQLPPRGRILEVGCGSGGLLAAAASMGRAIEGVDIALRWLVIGRRRLADRGLRVPLTGACAEALPYPDGTFAALVVDSVLEHLDDPRLALSEWLRVVRPGGRLIVWSPNRFSLTADPHVGLVGVGWLPTAVAASYVRVRRECEWVVRPQSAAEAARLASEAGWTNVRASAPELPVSLGTDKAQRLALSIHGRLRRHRWTANLLRAFGPIWRLDAVRGPT